MQYRRLNGPTTLAALDGSDRANLLARSTDFVIEASLDQIARPQISRSGVEGPAIAVGFTFDQSVRRSTVQTTVAVLAQQPVVVVLPSGARLELKSVTLRTFVGGTAPPTVAPTAAGSEAGRRTLSGAEIALIVILVLLAVAMIGAVAVAFSHRIGGGGSNGAPRRSTWDAASSRGSEPQTADSADTADVGPAEAVANTGAAANHGDFSLPPDSPARNAVFYVNPAYAAAPRQPGRDDRWDDWDLE